jgi:integrase
MNAPRLKGLAKIRKTLATGKTITYCYAWRAGPLLKNKIGEPIQPDDPALPAAYEAAHEARRNPQTNDLAMLITRFRKSTDFTATAHDTQREYNRYLDQIREKFGSITIEELQRPMTRGKFKEWRDSLARTPRAADYAWMVLARVLSVAKDRGTLAVNICERGGRLSRGGRAEKIWTDADIARFDAVAPAYMRLALLLGLWTGQRQGDLLRLAWTAYDGTSIRLKQSKTGARVTVPLAAPVRAALDTLGREGKTVLLNSRGQPWTKAGFQTSWRKICEKAGIKGLTYHDLRGTTVTRLALAGCTVTEIAAVTGHSLKDVDRILDVHYLGGREELARRAIAKLEAAEETEE